MTDWIEVEDAGGGIRVVTLQRMPVNALNAAFLDEIGACLAGLEADEAVRAVILTGTGKVLSAGMDLKEALAFTLEEQNGMAEALNRNCAALYEFSKPLITAANGHAIAGGLFFVMSGDYRVAREGVLFGLTEIRVGVDFPAVPRGIAVGELGTQVARRIMLSGQNVSAEEALRLQIVDEVVPAGTVMERALDKAREYAALPPKTYASVKEQVRREVITLYRADLAAGSDPSLKGWFSEETHGAAMALLEAATRK